MITSVFVPILLSKLLWVRYQCPQRGPAPKRFAARARISLPIPRSMTDQPRFHRRVSCSKIRSGVAVVAYSPVPNAIRGRIRESLSQPRNLFGLESAAPENDQPFANLDRLRFARRANRSIQLRGNSSMRPPNFLSSAREGLRELQAISSCNRLRPGLRALTSWP